MEQKYNVSSNPHVRDAMTTSRIMQLVVIALLPATLFGIWNFGFRALLVVAVTVASSVFFEWIYDRLMHKPNTITDFSAVVTGLLLALNMPPQIPLWMPVLGSAFAIIVVKQLFGGLGQNFMNPALAGRAFLLASWPVAMTTWVRAHSQIGLFSNSQEAIDAATAATPMAILKGSAEGDLPSVMSMFLGQCGGSMGEVSAIALLIGGVYLLMRKVITIHIPAAYILTVAVLSFIFPQGGYSHLEYMLYAIFGGGLMLGAIFMATDYSTTPVSKKGQVVFGIGCGLLTIMIRFFGGYPEGVCYSILLMNTTVWLIDKYTRPTKFGAPAKQKKEG